MIWKREARKRQCRPGEVGSSPHRIVTSEASRAESNSSSDSGSMLQGPEAPTSMRYSSASIWKLTLSGCLNLP